MSESNNKTIKSNTQNNLFLVDSAKILLADDNRGRLAIDKNNNNVLLPNFQNKILKVIKEKEYEGELDITDSMLLGLEDFYSPRNSAREEENNFQLDLDLNGMDFSEILKSQAKSKSSRIGNFQTGNKNNQSSAEKFLRENADCLNFNFSSDKLELRDEDIQMLFGNLQSQKKVYDSSPIHFSFENIESENNMNEISDKIVKNKIIDNNLKIYRTESVNCPAVFMNRDKQVNQDIKNHCNVDNCESANKSNIINLESIDCSNSNIIGNNSFNCNMSLFQADFETLLTNQLNFYNHFKEKIEEMESIKTRVNNLNSAFQNFNSTFVSQSNSCKCVNSNASLESKFLHKNNNFPKKNENKQLKNEKIIIFDSNEMVSSNFNKSFSNNIKENFSEKNDFKASNLNFSSNNILGVINPINSKNQLTEENSKNGLIAVELKRSDMNNKEDSRNDISNFNNTYNSINSFTATNRNNQEYSKNEENTTSFNVNSRNNLTNINNEENNKIFVNEKKNNIIHNYMSSQFVHGKMINNNNINNTVPLGSSSKKGDSIVYRENIQDDAFDHISNNKRIQSHSGNRILDKSEIEEKEINSILESVINIEEIGDDEFDNVLNNLKINKSITNDSKSEFIKSSKFSNSEFTEEKKSNDSNIKTATFTSDFICNNNPIKYKTNDRVLKLMSEMEKETGEDLCQLLGEEKDQIKIKEKTYNNLSNLNKEHRVVDNKDQLNKMAFIKPAIGSKRNFNEHLKTLNDSSLNDAASLESNKLKKRFKTEKGFKIDKKDSSVIPNSTSNKTKKIELKNSFINSTKYEREQSTLKIIEKKDASISLKDLKEKIQQSKDNLQQSISPSISDKCQFLCICLKEISEIEIEEIKQDVLDKCLENSCIICKDKKFISTDNFLSSFLSFAETKISRSNSDQILEKQIETFLMYQYRYVTWKFHILFKVSENKSQFTILNIFEHIYNKYKIIFDDAKRSFLTKVAENKSSINRYMTLQIFDIKKSRSIANPNIDIFIMELTDGYKSVYSEITNSNPISKLIKKNILYPGMKLSIGLAKIEKVSDDYEIFIQIFYNSISKADITSKLGQTPNKFFLIKNLSTLRMDGGEISQIDVIVLKKYDYFVYDSNKITKYSKDKFVKIIQQQHEDTKKNIINSFNEENLNCENEILKRNTSNECVNSESINNLIGSKNSRLITNNDNKTNNKMTFQGARKEDQNFVNQTQNSSYEGIFYTFKIIVVDSLLWYDYLNSVGRNSKNVSYPFNEIPKLEVTIEESLKKKLLKKSIIKFHTKNLNPFNNMNKGSRYQLAHLNKDQNEKDPSTVRKKFQKLKGNESTLIKEIKFSYPKYDSIYQGYLHDMSSSTNTPLEDIDICESIYYDYLSYLHLINKEFSFEGIYLNRCVDKKSKDVSNVNEDSAKFIFFVTKENNLVMIEIHDENFFDISKFTDEESILNPFQIFSFKNLNFKMLYFFDNFSTKNLIPFKSMDIYDKHFDKKFVVIFMKTCSYTSFKIDDDIAFNYQALKNKIYETKSEKKQIYEQILLDDVIKSI